MPVGRGFRKPPGRRRWGGEGPVGAKVSIIQIQTALPRLKFLLISHILPNHDLVEAHRAHTIPRSPEMQPCYPLLLQQFPVDSYGDLPFQKPNRVRHAELRRNAQAHMNMVVKTVSFQQVYPSLATQLPQYLSKSTT